MDVEAAVRSRLLSNQAVAARVNQRVYWTNRPQNVAGEAITLTRFGNARNYTHDGETDLRFGPLQVDCWSDSHAGATALANAVVGALSPAAALGGINFGQSFVTAETDAPVEDLPGGTKAIRRILEFSLYWKET